MDDGRTARTILETLVTLLALWYMLPTHQRRQWLMLLARRGQTWAQRMAQRMGRYAIRRDLAGDTDAAAMGYDLAHRLMTGPYQTAGTWYDSLRES